MYKNKNKNKNKNNITSALHANVKLARLHPSERAPLDVCFRLVYERVYG